MYNKLFTLLLVVVMIGAVSTTFSTDRYKSYKIVRNGDALRGDNGPFVYNSQRVDYDMQEYPIVFQQSDAPAVWTITETNVNARTQYDLQSNSVLQYIWQNPANPSEMHAVFMTSTDPGPNWADRNARYFYTSNGGTSWDYIGTVATTRAGFPCITATSDSRAVIMAHCTENGGVQRAYMFVDVFAGAGTWTTLDPGLSNTALGNIWAYAYATRQSPSKVLFVGSQNGVDSCKYNVATNLTSPGTFLGWQTAPNGETAEQYFVAISDDGTRYGVATLTLSGGAQLIESTNGGTTFGAPQTIYNYNPADSMGTLRSISLIYKGNTPCVALGLCSTDPVAGQFRPGLPAKMMFWSPSINGGNLVKVDSADGLNGSNSTNDVFLSVTRGVIGLGQNGGMYIAYNKARQDTSSIGNNFFDIYLSYSLNNGATWSTPTQLTNTSGPLRDFRYVSISPWNSGNTVNLISQRDSIPGSNVNGAPASTAQMVYIKGTDVIGIQPISSEVPTGFQLMQNYPNPFNPTTKIRFALPVSGFATLKIYDAAGKEVGNLLSQNLTAGTFEYELKANNLPSGVYFYRLQAGNFTETKKMVLVK